MSELKKQFVHLAPTDDVDLDVYEDAIDYAFDSPKIKNVAISGAYCSGKSSILASYKKKHSDKKFICISLAHFQSPNENEKKESTEVEESVLEGKILNQLIHQIPSEKIPQTNFRVKKQVNKKSIINLTVEVVLFIIATIYFTCFNIWKNFVLTLPNNWIKSVLLPSTHKYLLMLDGLILVVLISFITYKLIYIQKNKNIFRKLNLQGTEIEIFEESDNSYFDKYLNEVLYLFENADADVILFEDMDRFNGSKIFERLREVNTLVNIKLKESNKILRFFYVLRDDIFVSKDRTKFFDYIVPIVPVVDGSNSYDQFISHFKRSGTFEQFDESFLQGLSIYIDDMRLLKNICNEFIIYYNRLNITELDCNKMLAIIAYKNLFPHDFADLQLNKGFVYTLFNNKEKFIEEEMQKIKIEIEDRNSKICAIKNEPLTSIRELDVLFAQNHLRRNYSTNDYNDEDLHNFVLKSLSENEKKEYLSREQILEDKLNQNSNQLSQEISNLNEEIIKIKSRPLHKIINRDNIDEIFAITSENEIKEVTTFNEIKSSEYFDLLKYLIRNGYIDETYADYMTYFYENSLSRIDKMFLRSITDKKKKEYGYKLKNPDLVVSRLRLADFDQEEILNFDLLTYLLQKSRKDFLERLIAQLKNTHNFKFIGAYFDITTEISTYIQALNISWPEIFETALNEKLLTEEQIRKYSILTLYYSNDNIIKSINKNNVLSNYISNSRDYLSIDNPKIDTLIKCFKMLDVHFIGFDYEKINKDLFYTVYKNSLYKINEDNIYLVQKELLKQDSEEDFLHKNYTLLQSKPDSAITKYINQNINEYLDVVLQISNEIIQDDENVVIAILNNHDLTIERKQSYISVLNSTINSIKEIKDVSLWPLLLKRDVVQYSENNIMDYFNALELSEDIISFINRGKINLDFSKAEYDDNVKEKLFNSVVVCDNIDNSKYKEILQSMNFYYKDFNITGISEDKMSVLINTLIIEMTQNNLFFVRQYYPEVKYNFIQKNIKEYVDIIDINLFSQEELSEILNWDISDELKIKLLEFTNNEISIVGKNYSPMVYLYILKNNFMRSDLPNLFSSFEEWDNSVKSKILEFAVENINNIIDNPKSISDKLKDALYHSDKLTKDYKLDLLVAMMPEISEDYIKKILSWLDLPKYINIFDPTRKPKFEINDENVKLLSAFKKKNLIKDYEESKEKNGYYRIIRLKQKAKTPISKNAKII